MAILAAMVASLRKHHGVKRRAMLKEVLSMAVTLNQHLVFNLIGVESLLSQFRVQRLILLDLPLNEALKVFRAQEDKIPKLVGDHDFVTDHTLIEGKDILGLDLFGINQFRKLNHGLLQTIFKEGN
jgi:hypothetical protein